MTEHAQKRITIVAAILTILSVIWYFLKPNATAQVVAGGSTVAPSGKVSDPVLFGVDGSPDQVEGQQTAAGAAQAAVTGAAQADDTAAGRASNAYLFYNLAPTIQAAPNPTGHGCGCGPVCTSKAPTNLFPDGQGACLSSTVGTLTRSIEACIPGINRRALDNLMSNVALYGGDLATAGGLD